MNHPLGWNFLIVFMVSNAFAGNCTLRHGSWVVNVSSQGVASIGEILSNEPSKYKSETMENETNCWAYAKADSGAFPDYVQWSFSGESVRYDYSNFHNVANVRRQNFTDLTGWVDRGSREVDGDPMEVGGDQRWVIKNKNIWACVAFLSDSQGTKLTDSKYYPSMILGEDLEQLRDKCMENALKLLSQGNNTTNTKTYVNYHIDLGSVISSDEATAQGK